MHQVRVTDYGTDLPVLQDATNFLRGLLNMKLTSAFMWWGIAAIGAVMGGWMAANHGALVASGEILPPEWLMWVAFVMNMHMLGVWSEKIFRQIKIEKKNGGPKNPLPDPKWDNLPSAPYFNKARLR